MLTYNKNILYKIDVICSLSEGGGPFSHVKVLRGTMKTVCIYLQVGLGGKVEESDTHR